MELLTQRTVPGRHQVCQEELKLNEPARDHLVERLDLLLQALLSQTDSGEGMVRCNCRSRKLLQALVEHDVQLQHLVRARIEEVRALLLQHSPAFRPISHAQILTARPQMPGQSSCEELHPTSPPAGHNCTGEGACQMILTPQDAEMLWPRMPQPVDQRSSQARRDGDDREDPLRSVPMVVPKLADSSSNTASLEAGDWLAQLRPLIGDITEHATQWWDSLVETTMKVYRAWLASGPLERLRISAPERQETSANRICLDQRVTMLMTQALPDAVKSEVIATRQLHAAGVLFRVLWSYQPGGLSERATLLAAITRTTPAKSALEAAESLRMWRRQVSRAMELEATLPDCTLQVRALDHIMSEVLSRDAQASFRVSTFRFQRAVDVFTSSLSRAVTSLKASDCSFAATTLWKAVRSFKYQEPRCPEPPPTC